MSTSPAPPLRSPVSLRPAESGRAVSSLPRPLTSFVGRTREVAAVRAMLQRADVRLLTLTGPGGVGKTRLALRVAEDLSGFPDGTWFVALAPVRDPALVGLTIAQALGVQPAADEPVEQAISAFLADRRALLVLDNFEHVLPAGPLVAALLQECPSLSVLVTSRAVLRVSGEHAFAVPPMALLDADHRLPVELLRESDAVRLFVVRAAASAADFGLTPDNAPAVVGICHRLDGLPLAIELAAARVTYLPPAALLTRLKQRLPLLIGGPRDQPARLRTMRAAIVWSHDLLSAHEQILFRRLAVFVGGFTLEAAEAVAGDRADVLDGIASLVAKSLLRAEDGPGDEPRYRMLETIREFGLERLEERGEVQAVRQRHAEFFCALAEQAETPLFASSAPWRERLNGDHGNLRAALAWAIEGGLTETALRFVGVLRPFWHWRGEFTEGRSWAERALAMDGVARPSVRIKALETASRHAEYLGDIARAVALGAEGLALARSCDDQFGVGRMLLRLGETVQNQRHDDRAQAYLTEALAVFRGMDKPNWAAPVVKGLAWSAIRRGDYTEAERWAEEGLVRERALATPWGIGNALMIVAEVARRRGDTDRAASSFRESLAIHWREGHRYDTMWRLENFAVLAAGQSPARATRLFGAAEALRDEFGMPLEQVWKEEAHDPAVVRVRAVLGEQALAAGWAAGRALPLEAAVAEALDLSPVPDAPVATTPAHGLTPRELAVLRLVVDGKTDAEIAGALFISRRTAGTHVRHIYDKLDVTSRAAATAFAIRHGLV